MKHDNVYAGKSKISKVTIISIVVPIAASVLLLVLAYCFLTRRARKKFNDVKKGEKSKKSDHIQTYQGMKVDFYSNHVSLFS
jgi:preprotein translocase subunit YajC